MSGLPSKLTKATMHLPVFLPGNNREFKEIQGLATINDQGEINILLQHKEHALELVKMRDDGILFALGFDYMGPSTEAKPEEKK